MKYDELMSKFFGFSIPTYYNWKKENRPVIHFINSFSVEQIEEFLEFGELICDPRILLIQFKNKIIKFVDVIGIAISMDNKSMGEIDEIDKFLNVLVYTLKHIESYSNEYKTENLKQDLVSNYDDYKKLYDVTSWNVREYIVEIDELKIDEIDFTDLSHNNFKQLIFYSTNYNIKYFNLVLKFYLKYIYFDNDNKEEKITEIYEQTKASYQNKKTAELIGDIIYNGEKSDNYTLVFNYDLFKELTKNKV